MTSKLCCVTCHRRSMLCTSPLQVKYPTGHQNEKKQGAVWTAVHACTGIQPYLTQNTERHVQYHYLDSTFTRLCLESGCSRTCQVGLCSLQQRNEMCAHISVYVHDLPLLRNSTMGHDQFPFLWFNLIVLSSHKHIWCPLLNTESLRLLTSTLIKTSVTLQHLDAVAVFLPEIVSFCCKIISSDCWGTKVRTYPTWAKLEEQRHSRLWSRGDNTACLVGEAPFPLVESMPGLVYWKLRCCSTAVPALFWYSEECTAIQVNEM